MARRTEAICVTVLESPKELLRAMERLASSAESVALAYAWISGVEARSRHWKALENAKVRRAVIGVHFAQTEPEALRRLHARGVLRVSSDPVGVYHPKLFLAKTGKRTAAIVGSSNFTSGGYGKNVEMNVLLEGPSKHPEMKKLEEFIDGQWEACPPRADMDAWLEEYTKLYRSRPKPPREPSLKAMRISALDVGWREYLTLIKAQQGRELSDGKIFVWEGDDGDWSYLSESERSGAAFKRYREFARIPLEERKVVTGWGEGGWFGAMRSAGHFKAIVTKNPQRIGRVIDHLPLRGDVDIEVATKLVDQLCKIEYVGLTGATRVLAMKRPDVFFCVNKANKQQMDEAFGHSVTTRDGYLAALERIWAFPWASARKPKAKRDERIWNARVALLDALFYDGRAER